MHESIFKVKVLQAMEEPYVPKRGMTIELQSQFAADRGPASMLIKVSPSSALFLNREEFFQTAIPSPSP